MTKTQSSSAGLDDYFPQDQDRDPGLDDSQHRDEEDRDEEELELMTPPANY